jgi:hypothetical protein
MRLPVTAETITPWRIARYARSQGRTGVVSDLFWADRGMIKLLSRVVVAILVLLFPAPSLPQSHSRYPVDIIAGSAPQALVVDGRTRLVYELHLTNFAPWPIEITGIDVLGNEVSPLASYGREALNTRVVPVEQVLISIEPTDITGKSRKVGEGHTVVIFIDLVLDPGVPFPLGTSS